MDYQLSKEEKIFLLKLARQTIHHFLKNEPLPKPDYFSQTLKEKAGAFVTLHIDGNLRGCIGYVAAIKPLQDAVSDLAISAAFNDPRFQPLTLPEFEKIDIEISVLTPLERVDNVSEIQVGRDGLLIRQPPFEGLLLPQVAVEYNWDTETFLRETCHKAGLPGDCWSEGRTEIYKFQALIFSEHDFSKDELK
ncbi:MAG TPA: AmmeMemoRadiSam system protein A [Caldithrix abyssi]|uniref:AmmeMemoRadiSam system protein A n=1 Tax=Caldithrix abyssi TaxID=187145 RepID=A0A7V5PN36_CALAY|nr:AmmeMemoRadiSam system protein A [Caldithrix abyssi]